MVSLSLVLFVGRITSTTRSTGFVCAGSDAGGHWNDIVYDVWVRE
jgi:hypothetical protein